LAEILLYFVLIGICATELGSACIEIFIHKRDATPVLVFAATAGMRFWACLGAAAVFVIEDRVAWRAQKAAERAECEQQPAVAPVEVAQVLIPHSYGELQLSEGCNTALNLSLQEVVSMERESTKEKDERLTESSPEYRSLQSRTELAIKAAGYGGICFAMCVTLQVLRSGVMQCHWTLLMRY
jgi:hypothetical protein